MVASASFLCVHSNPGYNPPLVRLVAVQVSTRIVGGRTALYPPFHYFRAPHDFTQDPSTEEGSHTRVAVQAVAAVLKKEAIPGMSILDISGRDTPLKHVVHAARPPPRVPVG